MSRWSVLLGATTAIVIASITGCKNNGGAENLGFFVPPANLAAIVSVIPNEGSILGSTAITIIGSNIAPGATTASVGNTQLIDVATPNTFTLTGVIPAGNYAAGPADVSFVTSSQTAILKGGYTFAQMTFTSITPNNGPITGNIAVTIVGTNFANIPLNGISLQSVTNNAITALLGNVVVNATFTQISAIVPPGLPLGTYNLIIFSTSFGTLNAGPVYSVGTGQSTTLLITDVFLAGNPPVRPAHGPLAGGTTVTLNADISAPPPAGFTGGINVTLIFPNGTVETATGITVASIGTLTFVTPAGPAGFFGGPVTIRVDSSTQGFALAVNGFNYDPANTTPAINSISPAIGPQGGGTLVTVLGINFESGNLSNVRQVLVGGNPAPGVTVQSNSQLEFSTPTGLPGQQPVVIVSTTGAQSNAVNFTYQESIVITQLDPNNGPLAGGNSVTILGANFTTATIISGSITIAGNAITGLSVVNSGTVTGIVPQGASDGAKDVVVAANGGLPGMTLHLGYTYGPSFDEPKNRLTNQYNPVPVATPGNVTQLALGQLLTLLDGVTVDNADNAITLLEGIDADAAFVGTAVIIANTSPALGGASPFNNPIDVKIADMNGDGVPDIIVLNNGAGGAGNQSVVVLLSTNPPTGTYTALPAVATNTLPSFAGLAATSIDVAALTGNGIQDVAVLGGSNVVGTQNGVGVFINNGTGTLTANATFDPIGAAELGAVKLRIAGPTSGFLSNPFSSNPPLDMTGSGLPDIVTLCETTGTVSVLGGNGNGTFTLVSTTSVGASNPVDFDLGDVADVGALAVITANLGAPIGAGNGSISVLIGDGAGALGLFANYAPPGVPSANYSSVVIGDVNFDCRLDVTAANANGNNLSVFLGNGDGTFSVPVQYTAESPNLATTANVTQIQGIQESNGLAAVVCIDTQPTGTNSTATLVPRHIVDAYLGGFEPSPPNPIFVTQTSGVQPQDVAFGDLTGDGREDMVLVNRSSSNVQVFIGDGFGNFNQPFAPIPLQPNTLPEGVLIARVDNTSESPSVLVACNGTNQVAFLRNFGGGSLGNPTYIPLDGSGPHQIVVQDMNSDGNADIVTVNQASNDVTVLLGDGTGGFTRAIGSPYPVGNGPLSLAVSDLTLNGSLDIATANFASDDVSVLLNSFKSATTLTYNISTIPVNGAVPTNPVVAASGNTTVTIGTVEPRSLAIGDLNGDGAPDIVVAGGFTGTLTLLYQKVTCQLIFPAGTNLAGVTVGDLVAGPPIGVIAGNTAIAAHSTFAKVTNVDAATFTLTVTDVQGGGRDASHNQLNALSTQIPGGFFFADLITDVSTGNSVGFVIAVQGVLPASAPVASPGVFAGAHFFQLSDYESDGTTINIGSPSVIIQGGTNLSVVKLFDMNSDGFLDIVVGDEGGSSVNVFINQAQANETAFGTIGLLQTAHNTPSFAIFQTTPTGTEIGGPLAVVSPAGEFSFFAADTPTYGFGTFPAVPHNGYPIFLDTAPPISGGSGAEFKQTTTGHVLGMDIAHVTLDCPPSVAVVGDDNTVTVYKAN